MKKLFTVITAAVFLLIPLMSYAQSTPNAGGAPPVEQVLVREGDFAIRLAEQLKIGSPGSEAEAESMLASIGIAPQNGWTADYPVTPDIIGELENAIGVAVDSNRLVMEKDQAIRALGTVSAEMGLPVTADSAGEYAEEKPPEAYAEYSDPAVTDYYETAGPPVVTYYPPPPDYYYMYAWVPYPFWGWGVWFPGFFVLHDFDVVVINKGRHCRVTNHFVDPRTRRVATIDPAGRRDGKLHRWTDGSSRNRGFASAEAQKGAREIYRQSLERPKKGNVGSGTSRFQPRDGAGPDRNPPASRIEISRSRENRGDGSTRMPGAGGRVGKDQTTPNRQPPSASFNSPRSGFSGDSSRHDFSSGGSGRTHSGPSAGGGGFSGGIWSSGGSGGLGGGGGFRSSGGLSRGGFSGGGCRGRC